MTNREMLNNADGCERTVAVVNFARCLKDIGLSDEEIKARFIKWLDRDCEAAFDEQDAMSAE